MAWHVFEKLLEGVANHSTFIGKIWITFLFIFRIIMVASVGDTVYNDEQSAFICNTLQPGCTNICFNKFSPISQIRFWAVQILFVGTPSVVFIVFAMHKMSTISNELKSEEETSSGGRRRSGGRGNDEGDDDKRRQRKENRHTTSEKSVEGKASTRTSNRTNTSLPQYDDVAENGREKRTGNGAVRIKEIPSSKESMYEGNNRLAEIIYIPPDRKKMKRKTVYHKDGQSEVVKTPAIARAYFAQAIIRMCVEAVFLYLQYHMYRFEVRELFVCEGFPCPKQVDCFVSRPMEKTLFLRFMYAMTALSLLLNFLELVQLLQKSCSGKFGRNSFTIRRQFIQPRDYMASNLRSRGGRHYHQSRSAYPELGPFPRKHGNSFIDSDDDVSIDSDYRFYD